MDIFAILIGLIILAALAFYISRPLVRSRSTPKFSSVDAVSLEARRESLYTQIKELDLDHATGKVNEEDYTRLRAELVGQAAEVLRQIDGIVPTAIGPAPAVVRSGDDDLEALIAARRKTRSAPAPKTAEADVEAAIAARRKKAATESVARTCPQCGKPVKADDAFCAKCGAALTARVTP